MRISDWSSDVCSSDLNERGFRRCCLGPVMAQPAPYITAAEASETLVHMLIVAVPTWLIAPTAARKTSARINPYSTAVAALVDRISLLLLRIVPPPPKLLVPRLSNFAQVGS